MVVFFFLIKNIEFSGVLLQQKKSRKTKSVRIITLQTKILLFCWKYALFVVSVNIRIKILKYENV